MTTNTLFWNCQGIRPKRKELELYLKENVIDIIALTETFLMPGFHQIVKLELHGTIYRPDSFVLMLRYFVNLKAIRYESTSLNRIVADKSHRVIVA